MYFPVQSFLRPTGPGAGGRCSQPLRRNPFLLLEDLSGFTLLEILIAVFIFGTVLSIIYTSYTGTFRIVNETEYEADVYRMARIALERISEDLASVYVPRERESSQEEEASASEAEIPLFRFVGQAREVDGIRADTLSFPSLAHLVFSSEDHPGGAARIGYTVEEGEEGEGFALHRSDDPGFGLDLSGKGTGGAVLCDHLRAVSFTYYDAGGHAHDDWDSGDEFFRETTPQRVSILLEFVNESDPEAPYKFMTGVTLPIREIKEQE